MAETTKIQWCDATFNPWLGCTKVAEGCTNCYAEMMMDTRYGKVKWGPQGTRTLTTTWNQPKAWNKRAAKEGQSLKVFCASLCDVFEDWTGPILDHKGRQLYFNSHQNFTGDNVSCWPMDQPGTSNRALTMDDMRLRLFCLIDACPSLTWLLLTKRPENVRRMWRGPNRQNVWIGTSIANQKNADEYIPQLLSCSGLGSVLFLSIEPQIGLVDLARYLYPMPTIQWVICGGESQQGGEARGFDINWARLLRRQCREATVPFFMKQVGSAPREGARPLHLNDRHGGDWNEWPKDLRIRECPEAFYCVMEPVHGN